MNEADKNSKTPTVAVAAALLRQGRLLHCMSAPITLAALLALPALAYIQAITLAIALMLIALIVLGVWELVLALRTAFDAELLSRIEQGLALAELDQSLQQLRLAPASKAGRNLETRLFACLGLLKWQAAALLGQCTTLVAGSLIWTVCL